MDEAAEKNSPRYAGFWPRFAAGLLDAAVHSLLSMPVFWVASVSRNLTLIVMTALFALQQWLEVYLTVRFGGTLGELALGQRVLLVDGSKVTWRAAVLSVSVQVTLTLLLGILGWIGTLQISNDEYITLSLAERTQRIGDLTGHVGRYVEYTIWTWSAAEMFCLLLNNKRRTVHDFIAGTVVVLSGQGLFRWLRRRARG